jgi:integrase
MASVRKHPKSKYWFACFTLPDGRQTQRSTRETDRKKALRKAEIFEDSYRRGLNETQARRVISDLYVLIHGESLNSSKTKDFLDGWLERKKVEASPATFTRYQSVINQFSEYLGDKVDRDLAFVTAGDITIFRDSILKRLSPASANLALKILRIAFTQALREGLLQSSPASQVKTVSRHGEESSRRPFTLPELRSLLEVANDEWRGIILFGLYTGQRLKDIASLTWQNIDLQREELKLSTGKTGRRQIIPLAAPLLRYLEEIPVGDDPKTPLFPKAHAGVVKLGDLRTISGQFYSIMVSAGLVKERSRENTGRGRSVHREASELSFHCLRHTATSLMKNAGIGSAIVQDLIGHESAAVSNNYTHIEEASKRKAVRAIPDITMPLKKSKSKKSGQKQRS